MTGLISPLESVPAGDADAVTDTDDPSVEPATGPATLDAVRALVLKAHPDVVPELLAGSTIDDLLASVAPAQAAHARLVATIQQQATSADASNAPRVPAGGGAPLVADPDRLPAAEKIRRGVFARRA